jgi:membrane protein DedA with SNARE-associated domain
MTQSGHAVPLELSARDSESLEHIGHIAAALEPFVRHYGVFAVSLILAFESLGAPLPGETLLIFASVLAQRGEMSLPALLIFTWAGSVIGDNIGYLIGKTICRKTITRYGAKIGLTDVRLNDAEKIFSRYGSATVLSARFFPVLRQLNGIVAGALGMPWWRFVAFNAIGAALWVGTWVFIATYFSGQTASLAHNTQAVVAIAGMGLVILLVSLFVRHLRHDG